MLLLDLSQHLSLNPVLVAEVCVFLLCLLQLVVKCILLLLQLVELVPLEADLLYDGFVLIGNGLLALVVLLGLLVLLLQS